jgi:hypothetical protein
VLSWDNPKDGILKADVKLRAKHEKGRQDAKFLTFANWMIRSDGIIK